MGGDGTLHEVVNGLFIQQEVCPDEVLVAVVAVGTGNDWVRTFGISNRYQDAVKAISEGYSFLQDVGVVSYEEAHYCQSRYMANVAGAGFDAHVVRKLSHLKKKGHRSRWRYTWCLVKNFFRYKSTGVKVWVDDRLVYNNLLLSAAIGICKFNGGGIQQLPAAVADDGMLDLSLIDPHDAHGPQLPDGRHAGRGREHTGRQGQGREIGERHPHVRPRVGQEHDVRRGPAGTQPVLI